MENNENHWIEMLKDSDLKHAITILDTLKEDNIDGIKFADFFSKLKIDVQLALLDNWSYSNNYLYDIINYSENGTVINKIVNSYNIELSSPKINIEEFFEKLKKINLNNQVLNKGGNPDNVVSLPVNLITEKLAKKIWEENVIFIVRRIISDSTYSTTSTLLNEYVKEREREFIDNYNEIKESVKQFAEEKSGSPVKEIAYNKIVDLLNNCHNPKIIDLMQSTSFYMDGKALFSKLLKRYIIDYSFEIPYDNEEVLNYLKGLLTFCRNGHMNLSPEKEALYDDVVNISKLEDRDALELFNKLKAINVLEMFYDDIKEAERIRNLDIKENCLTKKQVESFLNDELSQKYGIPIYTPNDRPFIVLEKSMDDTVLDDLPTGHSFSIVSDKNPNDIYFSGHYQYIYDSSIINPNQIVHVFPSDSYTIFHPFQGTERASEQTNVLMDAEELIEKTEYYNEILILEQGTDNTDMDKNIPSMKKIALYCVNEINEEKVEKAKEEGLGIFLVYEKNNKMKSSISK